MANVHKKLVIELEVDKITKAKIVERRYTDKEGHEIIKKLYTFDAIVNEDEQPVVAEGETWVKRKTGFCAEQQTKEERESKAKSNYVGNVFVFEKKLEVVKPEVKPEEIPF